MRRQHWMDSLESRRLLAAGFQISLVYEPSVTAAVQSVIQQAATRWQQVITGDVPDVGTGSWGAAVDDIRITARITSIDGTGNGVAQARPLFIRNGNHLPIAGEIEIDSADFAAQNAAGTLLTIVTHEIGHALGFGTIWSQFSGLTSGLGGSNPLFLGSNALREYKSISGNTGATGVPLENTGSTGTRDAHWRETTFKTELMTGFLGTGLNPLSRITIGQFQDVGYAVNYSAADAFSLGSSAGTITGLIYNDQNKNGVQDANELGLSGAAVYVDKNFNGVFDAGEPTTSANSSGVYTLSDVAPGSYALRPVLPSGLVVTNPSSGFYSITVTAGQTLSGKNFGIGSGTVTTGGSVSGTVFSDANSNGIKDSTEAGLSGISVYVDSNWNGRLDAGEKSTSTNASGAYTLSSISPGTYAIRSVVPSGSTLVSPSSGYSQVTISNGSALSGKNFAIHSGTVTAGGSVSGTVFSDANSNGIKDGTEAGLSGISVYVDSNWNGRLDAGEKSTTTNASGAYTLSSISAGTYAIRSVVPSGSTLVSPSSGYSQVTISNGSALTGKNFAIHGGSAQTLGTVSGTVFRDTNRNGKLDAGETGLAGYVIFLDTNFNGVRDASEKSTTSASNGTYSLTGIAAGGYNVTIVLGISTIISPSSKYWWTNIAAGQTVSGKNYAIA